MNEHDVIIVGAGIAGLSTAFHLVRRGRRVTLVERDYGAHNATWASAGMLAPIHELDFTELPLLYAGQYSKTLHEAWAEELGDIGLERSGLLEIALTQDDVGYLERQYAFQREQGLAVEWLTGRAIQAYEPELSQRIPAAIYAPQDLHVDNRLLRQRLMEYLARHGTQFIEATAEAWHNTATNGNAALQLAAGGHTYACQTLIWAQGASPQTPEGQPERVFPVKGQAITLTPPPGGLLNRPVRIRNRAYGNAYLVPKRDRLVLGGTCEEMGFDDSLTAGAMLDLLRKGYAMVPALYDVPIQEPYVAFRPASVSREPFVAQHEGAPVYYVNGLYRHGLLLAPLIGQAAARLIEEGIPFSLNDYMPAGEAP
jgi:glycine oxidase